MDSNNNVLLLSWLTVIGMLTMYWSPVERCIDQCVYFLSEQCPSKKPLTLNRKLEFIKNNLPITMIEQHHIDSLIKLTKSTVKIRDICVHGVLETYDKEQIQISKVNGKKEDYILEIFTIDYNRLDKSAKNLTMLVERWNAISKTLLDIRKTS